MSKKLKDMYTDEVFEKMILNFQKVYPKFNKDKFLELVKNNWENLELKQRFTRLAVSFYETLNYKEKISFAEVSKILIKLNEKCQGFKYMFFPKIVEIYGQGENDIDTSLKTLEVLTTGSSAEFAIRTFLDIDFDKTFKQMKIWSKSNNEHHRRLASEGIRTKLPWGKKVKELYNHSEEIIEILTLLNKDESLYVRKSVANNLNDLSKDFPELVIKTIKKWKKQENDYTNWIIKHGTRTLLKAGNVELLNVLNYNQDIKIVNNKFEVNSKKVKFNEESIINCEIKILSHKASNIRVSLEFNFIRLNNKISKKIFYLKDFYLEENEEKIIKGNKKYTWKNMSTRVHYSGKHLIRLLVNDVEINKLEIELAK